MKDENKKIENLIIKFLTKRRGDMMKLRQIGDVGSVFPKRNFVL